MFWLVLAYDLLEERRTIDDIITKFSFLLRVLRDWVTIRYKQNLVEVLNKYETQKEVRKSRFSFREWLNKKILEQPQSAVERDYKTKQKIDLALSQI